MNDVYDTFKMLLVRHEDGRGFPHLNFEAFEWADSIIVSDFDDAWKDAVKAIDHLHEIYKFAAKAGMLKPEYGRKEAKKK